MSTCCTPTPAPRVRNAAALTSLYQALADTTRLRILAILAQAPGGPGGELCVCHIHDSLGVSQPTASRHLAYLKKAGPRRRAARGRVDALPHRAGQRTRCWPSVFDAALHALGHADSTARDRAKVARAVLHMPAGSPGGA